MCVLYVGVGAWKGYGGWVGGCQSSGLGSGLPNFEIEATGVLTVNRKNEDAFSEVQSHFVIQKLLYVLGRVGLHLNQKGSSKLPINFISYNRNQ